MVLVDLLSGLGRLVKLGGKTDIDSPICKLHHKFTTTILFCFCILVTASNLVGDPINCTFRDHPLMKTDVINAYCWIHATFTLPRNYKSSKMELYPGVGTLTSKDEVIFHAYYQWVPFVLFLQALLFYVPYWLWKTWEGGKVKAAAMDLASPIMSPEERRDKIHTLAEYLHASLHHHNVYAAKYLFCELLNFAITIANISLINKLLGGKFISYGTDVFSFAQMETEDRIDPMVVLFPRMTKCTFKAFGSSGTIEKLDSLCVLPHNIINEKVYLFLWVWLWFLVLADALAIVWRCVVFFVPVIRKHLLKGYSLGLNHNEKKSLATRLQVGDYFLLYLLQKNVSRLSFSELVKEVTLRCAGKASDTLEMGERAATTGVKGYYNHNLMDEPR